jgi:hypothetical protein
MFIDDDPQVPSNGVQKWGMLMDYYMARATLITALNELNYANAMLIAD